MIVGCGPPLSVPRAPSMYSPPPPPQSANWLIQSVWVAWLLSKLLSITARLVRRLLIAPPLLAWLPLKLLPSIRAVLPPPMKIAPPPAQFSSSLVARLSRRVLFFSVKLFQKPTLIAPPWSFVRPFSIVSPWIVTLITFSTVVPLNVPSIERRIGVAPLPCSVTLPPPSSV